MVEVAHGGALLALGAQPLVDPRDGLETVGVVEGDEASGGVEDHLGGAVVLGEDDLPAAGVEPTEREQVGGGGAPPAVDGLVVVADHGEVRRLPRQELEHLELGVVGVLELVDQDPAEPLTQPGQGRRAFPQETEGPVDLVAEVHQAGLGQELLVGGVEGGELEVPLRLVALLVRRGPREAALGPGRVVLGRDVLVLGATDQGAKRPQVSGRVAQWPEASQRQVEDPLAEEDDLLRLGEHPELRVEADLEGGIAQHPVAEGVEGGDLGLRVAVGDQLIHPLRHLRRRLLGEGEGEDLLRPRALGGDQVGDAAREHGGLSGAGSGNDEERAVAVLHGLELVRVQALEDPRLGRHESGHHGTQSDTRQVVRVNRGPPASRNSPERVAPLGAATPIACHDTARGGSPLTAARPLSARSPRPGVPDPPASTA